MMKARKVISTKLTGQTHLERELVRGVQLVLDREGDGGHRGQRENKMNEQRPEDKEKNREKVKM